MRNKQRLRPLSEAEAYARCHGTRESDVKIVHIEPRRPRYKLPVSGEDLRRSFERKLAIREPVEETLDATAANGLAEVQPLEPEAAAGAGGGEELGADEQPAHEHEPEHGVRGDEGGTHLSTIGTDTVAI